MTPQSSARPFRSWMGLALALLALPCFAATKTWDGGAGTLNWGDGNNWDTNGTPASNDTIQFNVGIAANATVNVNVGNLSSPGTTSLALNNGAGFTLDFNQPAGSYNYLPTVSVSDAQTYTITGAAGKTFAFPMTSQTTQAFNIAAGGKLGFTGNFVVAGYASTNISKTGAGELDLTGFTNLEGTSKIASLTVTGGTLRARIATGSTYFHSTGATSLSLFGTPGSSVATAQSRSVAVSDTLALDGVTLTNDALNTGWAATTATVHLTNGGGLDVRGQSNVSIDKLTGTGKVYNSYSTGTLTVGGNGGSSTFDGVIYGSAGGAGGAQNYGLYNGNSGTLALTKTGGGSLTLTGTNVYRGTTTVSGGSLVLAGGDNRLSPDGSVTLGGAGKLVLGSAGGAVNQTLSGLASTAGGTSVVGSHASIPSVLTLNIAAGESNFGGTLGGTESNENKLALTKTGAGALGLSGESTYLGATTIAGGTVKLQNPVSGIPAGLQIMPMGDSITYGASPASGYRSYLHNLLVPVADGFQFVGASTLSIGTLPTSPINQTHHNGYSSYATLDFANNLDGLDTQCFDHWSGADRNPNGGYWFTGGHNTGRDAVFPDVILLMVGTNDINQGGAANPAITVPNYEANLTTLIDRIVTLRPDALLLLAKITPYPAQAATIASMNAIVATVVASFQAQGKKVSLVDLHTDFPAGGLSGDGVHPNAAGYSFMATQWHEAIVAAYATSGSGVHQGVSAASTVDVAAGANLDVNGFTSTIGGLTGAGSVTLGTGGILHIASANSHSFGGTISGNGNLHKSGAGTWTLGGDNFYTGTTTVNGGTLLINNTNSSTAVTVAAPATLGGTGTISGGVTVGGTLAPGSNGVGTLTTGAAVITGTYACQLAATTADALTVNGNLTLTGSALAVTEITPATATIYQIATYSGDLTGTFASVTPGYTVDTATPHVVKLVKSGYSGWASTHGIPGQAATVDHDQDGLSNGMEYALGLNPNQPNASPGTLAGDVLSFTKGTEAIANRDVTYEIEESDDLDITDPWTAVVTQTPPNTDPAIFHTLPTGKPRTFARLKVTIR